MSKSLLFIKDSESELNTDTDAFSQYFGEVDKAEDSKEAMKLAYDKKYDVILSDMTNNQHNAISLLKELKEKDKTQRIVSLFTNDESDNFAEAIDAGIDAFLIQPDQFDQALEAISQM